PHTAGRVALAAILTILAGTLVVGPAAGHTDLRSTTSGAAAAATDPSGVSFKLAGCKIPSGTTLPISGKFICADADYSEGNLGKGWNELDLVPLRITMDAGNSAPSTQTYSFRIAADYSKNGIPGWDFIENG